MFSEDGYAAKILIRVEDVYRKCAALHESKEKRLFDVCCDLVERQEDLQKIRIECRAVKSDRKMLLQIFFFGIGQVVEIRSDQQHGVSEDIDAGIQKLLKGIESDEAYTSHSTNLLDVDGVVKKIMETDYVKEELEGRPHLVDA